MAEAAALKNVLADTWRGVAGDFARQPSLREDHVRARGITVVQRFSSALCLKVHFHLRVTDCVGQ